jgi:excisionase family DNA binding protein
LGEIDWIGLTEASRMLGVSAGTLRRWSDAGRVKVFTTPGGHRRFSRTALMRLLPADASRLALVRNDRLRGGLTRAYRREVRRSTDQLPWLRLGDAEREWFRERGRRLSGVLLAHLDAQEPAAKRHQLRQATADAADYGRMTAGLGLSLSQSVEGFLMFRRPFLSELSRVAREQAIDTGETTRLLDAAERAMDRLLVSMMAAHSVEQVALGRGADALPAGGVATTVTSPKDASPR